MKKNKFYKNLFKSVSYFSAIMLLVFCLLLGFFESLNHGKNYGWISLIISALLIILFFLIGFYWIFQKVIIDENGIKIVFKNKVINNHKWDEIVSIKKVDLFRCRALEIKFVDGSKIHLDDRKSIVKIIKEYSQVDIVNGYF